jgi:zinc protease
MMTSRFSRASARRRLIFASAVMPLVLGQSVRGQADARASRKVPAKSVVTPLIDVPRIPFTRTVLRNGLVVLLHEDHSSPIVALDLTYHVGSMDEPVGKRGFAHLFEHSMFNGSANVAPGEHLRIIQAAGGDGNAHTWEDRTVYFERFPQHLLETVLWLEADRMAFLPARVDSARFESERAAVFNEIGLRVDAGPAAGDLAKEAFIGAMYPDPHPYHTTPFGVMSELRAATLDDMMSFFHTYYVPNNATLSIAGDFKTTEAQKLVAKYFGGIPRGAPVKHPAVSNASLPAETRIVLEDLRGNTRQLWIGWRTASSRSPDRMALVALSAILSDGPTSRLYQALVTDRKLATNVPSGPNANIDLEHAGFVQVVVVPTPTASMTDIEHVVDSVVTDLKGSRVKPEELRRWLARYSVNSIRVSQSDLAKAQTLAEGETIYGTPAVMRDDIDVARHLTPADLQRVARKYLTPGRVVLSIVPAGKLDLISKPDEPYTNVTRRKAP